MVINETNLIISPRKKEREFVRPSLYSSLSFNNVKIVVSLLVSNALSQ